MPERIKEVELKGQRYQIGELSAREGSWVVMQVLTKAIPGGLEGLLSASLPENRTVMTEAEFHNLQDLLLSVVRRVEKAGAPLPVFVLDSKIIAVPELKNDSRTILSLTIQSLMHNLSDFFGENGLTTFLSESLPALNS